MPVETSGTIAMFLGKAVNLSDQEMVLLRFLLGDDGKSRNACSSSDCICAIYKDKEPEAAETNLYGVRGRLDKKLQRIGLRVVANYRYGYQVVAMMSISEYERLLGGTK